MIDERRAAMLLAPVMPGLSNPRRLLGGTNHDVFLFDNSSGKSVVIKFGHIGKGDDLLLDGRILHYLVGEGVGVPVVPLFPSTQEPIEIIEDDVTAVVLAMSYTPGRPIEAPADYALLGQMLARMHAVPPPRFVPNRRVLDPRELTRGALPPEIAAGIGPRLEHGLATLDKYQRRQYSVCHGDMMGNSFVTDEGVVVFDFEL